MKKNIFIAYIILSASMVNGCKKSEDTPAPANSGPGTNEIWMQGTAFTPNSITVALNTTIKWTNKDNIAHTVTSNTSLFDSGTIAAGQTYNHQFITAGTFPYTCTIHPGMTGTVIVQ